MTEYTGDRRRHLLWLAFERAGAGLRAYDLFAPGALDDPACLLQPSPTPEPQAEFCSPFWSQYAAPWYMSSSEAASRWPVPVGAILRACHTLTVGL
eukprot:6492261-Amphidinium_carterae.1